MIKRLGSAYPLQEKVLAEQIEGTIENVQSSEVRYVRGLKGGASAVCTITLTDTAVWVTVVYGESRQVVTAEQRIGGEEAHFDVVLGEQLYSIDLAFEARKAGGRGWKLKKDWFKFFEKAVGSRYEGAMIDDSKKALAKVRLYEDSIDAVQDKGPMYDKSIGVLTVRIEGAMAHLTMEQNEKNSKGSLGADALGARWKQERVVRMVPMQGRAGLYESEALGSASVRVKDSTSVSDGDFTVVPGEGTVFAFMHTKSAASDAYKAHKYNTYDVRIREYDPETKRFVLEGAYDLKKEAAYQYDSSSSSYDAAAGCALLSASEEQKGKGLKEMKILHCRPEGHEAWRLEGHGVQGE